jgi:hypothetical protein
MVYALCSATSSFTESGEVKFTFSPARLLHAHTYTSPPVYVLLILELEPRISIWDVCSVKEYDVASTGKVGWMKLLQTL